MAHKSEELNLQITRLALFENWRTAGHMYQNYRGVDTAFEKTAVGPLRSPFLRWIGFPLYFGLLNEGYALRLHSRLAGVLYLQYNRMVAHINDIEVNRAYQGQGYSHLLLDFARKKAQERCKRFLTLVVTLTNTRALNLYRKSGFLDQHHHYYYLARPLEVDRIASPGAETHLTLRPLSRREAAKNLQHFFKHEIKLAEPVTGEVWEALYPPELPPPARGVSYALFIGAAREPSGHLDFFDWGGAGRWRLYLSSEYWGSPDETALFELLMQSNQSRGLSGLGIMLGSVSHHDKTRALARHLNFVERDTERMLMIKPL